MKISSLLAVAAVAIFVTACGGGGEGGGGVSYTPPPSAPSKEISWVRQPDLPGLQGNYLSLVINNLNDVLGFSNFNGTDNVREAKLYQASGTILGLLNIKVALEIPGAYLRTFAVTRGTSGVCYAILRLGTIYGQSSYYPAFAKTDASCQNWRLVKEKFQLINSDYNTLTVREELPEVVDHVNPRNNRFTFVDDGHGVRMGLSYSADGENWNVYSEGSGTAARAVELMPPDQIPYDAQFMSEVYVPNIGYFAIFAVWNGSVATRHVMMFSCYGRKFRTLDSNAPTFNGSKGTTMTYYPPTGDIHTLSIGGLHYTFKAQKLACAEGDNPD